MVRIDVQTEPFDAGALLNDFTAETKGAGAVVSFSGIVRDIAGGLDAMEIEHYPGMTEKALGKIATDAAERWDLAGVMVVHRYGRLTADAPIMMVLTAARHRVAAFEAAEFLMDYLKSRAPFWKKELSGGSAEWVAARDEDEDALSRW